MTNNIINAKIFTKNEIIKQAIYIMKSVILNLDTAESVKHFVNVVNKFDYDMDLRSGRHVVDAKSILGIFSLDLSTPVVLEVFSDNCGDLIEALGPFID